jgi:hypothetical protein
MLKKSIFASTLICVFIFLGSIGCSKEAISQSSFIGTWVNTATLVLPGTPENVVMTGDGIYIKQ